MLGEEEDRGLSQPRPGSCGLIRGITRNFSTSYQKGAGADAADGADPVLGEGGEGKHTKCEPLSNQKVAVTLSHFKVEQPFWVVLKGLNQRSH